eukprot:7316285-Prymnesium_polylepis.1
MYRWLFSARREPRCEQCLRCPSLGVSAVLPNHDDRTGWMLGVLVLAGGGSEIFGPSQLHHARPEHERANSWRSLP